MRAAPPSCAGTPPGRATPGGEPLRGVFGERALELAGAGGEDYELLVAGPERLIEALAAAVETALTVIGEVIDDASHRPRLLDAGGLEGTFASGGWDHLG